MSNNSSLSEPIKGSTVEEIALKTAFGVIATLAICGNGLLIFVILRNSMLKSSYNILIINLGFVDFITGISIAITPGYIIAVDALPVPGGVLGEIFCRVLFSQYLVFTLGIVSVYTVAFLALERWFAVARPTTYKSTCTRRRVLVSVVLVWFVSVLLNTPHLLEIKRNTDKDGRNTCQWFSLISSKAGRQTVALFEFLFKYFILLFLTFATFFSLRLITQTSMALSQTNQGKSGKRLLRMSIITAAVLGVCWFPNQLYYLLFKYEVKNTQLGTPVHYFTVTICMLNSCVNPWIYCVTNKSYRRQFAKVLFPWKQNEVRSWTSNTADDSQTNHRPINTRLRIKPRISPPQSQSASQLQSATRFQSSIRIAEISTQMDISVQHSVVEDM